ncbi:MAG: hypothetical protein AB7P03_12060 [Kofleriaceae bacterium]
MGADTKPCPYCAEDIKLAAVRCRYCGAQLAASAPAFVHVQPVQRGVPPRTGGLVRIVTVGILLMVFAILASIIGTCFVCGKAVKDVADKRRTEAAEVVTAAPVDVAPSDLEAAYEANEVAANDQYKGKVLRLDGLVTEISTDLSDDPMVRFTSRRPIGGVTCFFASTSAAAIARIRKGDRLAVRGRGDGYVMGRPVLRDCVVDSPAAVQAAVVEVPTAEKRRPKKRRLGDRSTTPSGRDSSGRTVSDQDVYEPEDATAGSEPSALDRKLEWRGSSRIPPLEVGAAGRPLRDAEISSTLGPHTAALQACVERSAAGKISARITLAMVVGGGGNIASRKMHAPRYLFENGLLACIDSVLAQVKFPAVGQPSSVSIPIDVIK